MTDSPPASSRAVVLLSGGLDSATVLAIAKHARHTVTALSFDYGQRHRHELRAAEAVANSFDITDHRLARIDLRAFGGSALTDTIDVPKDRDESAMSHGIPVTYVPARNTIFLSYALALAEVIGAADIYIGVNAVDYSGYPDCRPQYIQAFEQMANLATRAAVEGHIQLTVHTPLIDLPKPDIIRRGLELGVDYALTHSCYDPLPGDKPCEHCDACLIRQRAFASLGMTDPVLFSREPQASAADEKRSPSGRG